jgi:hypothetical protein
MQKRWERAECTLGADVVNLADFVNACTEIPQVTLCCEKNKAIDH